MTTTERTRRKTFLKVLSTMPDEAFGWVVLWASIVNPRGSIEQFQRVGQMFPDGLGGFSTASREAIDALRTAADKYMGSHV